MRFNCSGWCKIIVLLPAKRGNAVDIGARKNLNLNLFHPKSGIKDIFLLTFFGELKLILISFLYI